MVFYIDDTIFAEFSSREITEDECIFFEKLAVSRRYGHCTLLGDLSSLEILARRLPETGRNCFQSIVSRYSEQGALLSITQTVFILTFKSDLQPEDLPDCVKTKYCYIIPIGVARTWFLDKPCYLLAENTVDCSFYRLVAEYYCRKHGYQKVTTSFLPEHGGGNTMDQVLENCLCEHKVITLCIVDSDQKHGASPDYPNRPKKGDTLRNVKSKSKKLKENPTLPPHHVVPLYVHEVENLIPTSVLEGLLTDLPAMKPGLAFLKQLRLIKNGEPVLYYDFKKGFPVMKDAPMKAYWEDIFINHLGGDLSDMYPAEGAAATAPFPPLSNNSLLNRAVSYISANMDKLQVDDHLVRYWEDLGTILFDWGCAELPLFA